MGTSAPEAAVSLTSALKGNAGITIGNVVGSNIVNVLVILGLSSCFCAIAGDKSRRNCHADYSVISVVIFCTVVAK